MFCVTIYSFTKAHCSNYFEAYFEDNLAKKLILFTQKNIKHNIKSTLSFYEILLIPHHIFSFLLSRQRRAEMIKLSSA